jgi:hypothetical protein
MEEPMSLGVEEAIEESIEVREPVDEPTASLDAVEVEPEVGPRRYPLKCRPRRPILRCPICEP